jgi:hypothetical protein
MHTTNYFNTFIEIAEDCPTSLAEIPAQKGDKKTVANLQFEMVIENPYRYTSDDVLFQVFAEKNNIESFAMDMERDLFFSKGQPCMRASPLTKRYGWGVHANEEGRIAIYGADSEEYKRFSKDDNLKHVKAMRSKRG